MRFNFNYDKKTILITIVATILIIFGMVKLIEFFSIAKGVFRYVSLLFFAFLALTLIFSYLLSPLSIILGDKLIIDRIISKIYIDYSMIQEIFIFDAKELMASSIRVFGNGGLFGYYGRFKSDKLGNYYLYARRTSGKYCVIKTKDKTYVFAPEDVDMFIAKLKERCKL